LRGAKVRKKRDEEERKRREEEEVARIESKRKDIEAAREAERIRLEMEERLKREEEERLDITTHPQHHLAPEHVPVALPEFTHEMRNVVDNAVS
jgi:hypothetical protein